MRPYSLPLTWIAMSNSKSIQHQHLIHPSKLSLAAASSTSHAYSQHTHMHMMKSHLVRMYGVRIHSKHKSQALPASHREKHKNNTHSVFQCIHYSMFHGTRTRIHRWAIVDIRYSRFSSSHAAPAQQQHTVLLFDYSSAEKRKKKPNKQSSWHTETGDTGTYAQKLVQSTWVQRPRCVRACVFSLCRIFTSVLTH